MYQHTNGNRQRRPSELAPLFANTTVLVVEDDDIVRHIVVSSLSLFGFRVLEAQGGAHAMELARLHAGHIHLLLTDVMMPGMLGTDLAPKLVELRPSLRVVYMSGYPGDLLDGPGGQLPGATFLPKPFTPTTLVECLGDLLGAETSAEPPDHKMNGISARRAGG